MENDVHRDPACAPSVPGASVSAPRRLRPCALAPPGRILVIDDERSFVQGLAQLLRRDGYTVDTAENGLAALTQLQAHRYDVLVCDVRMPALNGPDLYARVLGQYASLSQRVIFLTGDTLGPTREPSSPRAPSRGSPSRVRRRPSGVSSSRSWTPEHHTPPGSRQRRMHRLCPNRDHTACPCARRSGHEAAMTYHVYRVPPRRLRRSRGRG